MRKAQKFGVGLFALQQMFYASISLGFHTADPSELDMGAEVDRLQQKYTPFPPVEGTSFHTSFGHLTGYSAIYYTYMWSLVIAKDLLTPFKKSGLMNAEWTAKYRDTILAPGGTKDAADLVETFLGREFNYAAFEDYLAR
jgi:thimet oligopeptidase